LVGWDFVRATFFVLVSLAKPRPFLEPGSPAAGALAISDIAVVWPNFGGGGVGRDAG